MEKEWYDNEILLHLLRNFLMSLKIYSCGDSCQLELFV